MTDNTVNANDSNRVLHRSVSLPSGSVTFLVKNVLYKLPLSILHTHSEAFSAMVDGHSEDEPIPLDDSEASFTLFYDVLMDPWSSCLNSKLPSNTTENLLDLLVITNKYCATFYEQQTMEQLSSRLNLLPLPLIIQALDVALQIGSDELAEVPRTRLMERVWASSLEKPHALALLNIAKRRGDRELRSAAYYAIMLHGQKWWSECSTLDSEDTLRIRAGMDAGALAWHNETFALASMRTFFGEHAHPCPSALPLLQLSARKQQWRRVQWYNVHGKLKATLAAFDMDVRSSISAGKCTNPTWCRGKIRSRLEKAVEDVQRDIVLTHFETEDDADMGQEQDVVL